MGVCLTCHYPLTYPRASKAPPLVLPRRDRFPIKQGRSQHIRQPPIPFDDLHPAKSLRCRGVQARGGQTREPSPVSSCLARKALAITAPRNRCVGHSDCSLGRGLRGGRKIHQVSTLSPPKRRSTRPLKDLEKILLP